jgi:hypothetical protein
MISGPVLDGRACACKRHFQGDSISANNATPRFDGGKADEFCSYCGVSDADVFKTYGHDATPEACGIEGKELEASSTCDGEIVAPDRLL